MRCARPHACSFFDPSAEYLPFLMLRYVTLSLLVLRLLQHDDGKKRKF